VVSVAHLEVVAVVALTLATLEALVVVEQYE
jgi:hypothetical protein